jgi:putative hydrolase of the HAD superfamily
MHTLKAVIFDYGKVLSLPPTPEQWQGMSTRFGKTPLELQQAYHDNRPQMDRGLEDYVAYWQKVGKDCNRQISAAEALELSEHDNWQWTNESPEVVQLARDLQQAGYKTGILSNMEKRMLAAMRGKLKWLDEFDVQIYSCEVGMVKPDAEIYRLACRRLGCEPHEALFLDDKKENTEAAKQMGMQSLVFNSVVEPVMLTGEPEITVAGVREMLLNGR